jgi:Cu/Ag efflux protein CusF
VIRTGTRAVVIVRKTSGSFEPREVKLGADLGDQLEIAQGLAEGDQVVASGQFLVDSEARLRSVLGAMTAAGQAATPAAPAAAATAAGTFTAQGKVESVEADGITISHGPVPELKWPSMTMGFSKPNAKAFPQLKAGDDVRFTFRQGGANGLRAPHRAAGRSGQVIAGLIRWSVRNRFLVLMATAFLVLAGIWSASRMALDALPDLSDTQVIVRTPYPGKAPQVVEDLVTYPLTTTMLSVPGAKTVRGYSFFGDSFVYVLFDDKTDPYWARSRVVEYLNQVQSRLPAGANASLGPDATGVGWVYEYALGRPHRVSTTSRNCAR